MKDSGNDTLPEGGRVRRTIAFGFAVTLLAATSTFITPDAGASKVDQAWADDGGSRIAIMLRDPHSFPADVQQSRVTALARLLGPGVRIVALGDGRFDLYPDRPMRATELRARASRLATIPDVLWAAPKFAIDTVAQANRVLAARERTESVPDSVIVRFRDFDSQLKSAINRPVDPLKLQKLSQAVGVGLVHERAMSGNAHVLKLGRPMTHREYDALLARLEANPDVDMVSGNYRAGTNAFVIPNDTHFTKQWSLYGPQDGYYGIDAIRAWTISTGSPTTIVSVVDTGIRPHVDLADKIVGGYDFIAREDNGLDPGDWTEDGQCGAGKKGTNSGWHGTHVSGTIAADANNGEGIAGINWKAKILPIRVLGPCGGKNADIIDGFTWASGLPVPGLPVNLFPARVINMSLGGKGACSKAYQEAINRVVAQGAFIVVAAGNEDDNSDDYSPASCLGVMTVAGTGPSGEAADYTNYSFRLEISAPGGDFTRAGTAGKIYSTINSGAKGPEFSDYGYKQGTSMAAPHVAGVASLMLSINPDLSPGELYYLLQATAHAFPSGSWCAKSGQCGAGIVSASAAAGQALAYKPYRLVYEFKNSGLNHYFRTAVGDEARAVNTGGAGPGWSDTLEYFYAWASQAQGTVPVCRFYGTPGKGPNSHFYTASATECQTVRQDPGWTYEGTAFYVVPIGAAGCPSGTHPVYRSYNGRAQFNDTNHRFTTSLETYQQMKTAGWINEGAVFCVT